MCAWARERKIFSEKKISAGKKNFAAGIFPGKFSRRENPRRAPCVLRIGLAVRFCSAAERVRGFPEKIKKAT
jgi:hypothetical protein